MLGMEIVNPLSGRLESRQPDGLARLLCIQANFRFPGFVVVELGVRQGGVVACCHSYHHLPSRCATSMQILRAEAMLVAKRYS
jgi:hypothetical protein